MIISIVIRIETYLFYYLHGYHYFFTRNNEELSRNYKTTKSNKNCCTECLKNDDSEESTEEQICPPPLRQRISLIGRGSLLKQPESSSTSSTRHLGRGVRSGMILDKTPILGFVIQSSKKDS